MSFNSILTREVECPDCFKEHKDLFYRYVDVFHGGRIIGCVALGIDGERCLLHAVVEDWSVEAAKTIKTAFFGTIVPGLKDLGIKQIIAVNGAEHKKKWKKFVTMFHFDEPKEYLYTQMEI